ncbi:GNAT family N-acetyltransferase [Pseudomonas putida]|uniref:GNAT family N-acetyltransferase n=2 Tax=Pseudomonas putida TaxID=303 RepID=UPI00105A787D|nr:GNAT family N-acetyltransferase [Pseudomonas putida]TDJ75798.1 GNAT family N-acetyltransferase [Pseudomonas putida]
MNGHPTDQAEACEHWVEKLDDGSAVLIRPLREEDHERDKRFLSTIAYESRRFRFIAGLSGGLPSLDTQCMPVDYHQRMAYVALAHVDGKLQQVGVSRYAGIPGSPRCECAVAVREDWQRKGLGRHLLQHLIAAARRNGYHYMMSRDLANNYAMHRLAKGLGFSSSYVGGDVSEILHELDLRPGRQGPCGP